MTFLRPAYVFTDPYTGRETECTFTGEIIPDEPFKGGLGTVDADGVRGIAYPAELRRSGSLTKADLVDASAQNAMPA